MSGRIFSGSINEKKTREKYVDLELKRRKWLPSFVGVVEDKMDTRTRYFQVVNKKATEKAIEQYKRWVSYKLGRLIPHQKIYSEKLKSDSRFIEECKFYGLTLHEGFNAVTACPKIGTQIAIDYSGRTQGIFLWRKEEG